MPLDEEIHQASLTSQQALLRLCSEPMVESDDAVSFVSDVERDSGFYSATLPRPGCDPVAVVAQARQVSGQTGRTNFVWAPDGGPVGVACWQAGLAAAYPLAVMSVHPGVGDGEWESVPSGVVHVRDHQSAELFRQVHLGQFSQAPDPVAAVEHFASDHVLLDESVRAVVVLDEGVAAAAGYLHTSGGASGIYWVATDPRFRHRGHASTVTAALLDLALARNMVVLQATSAGRPLYLRHGFQDHGLVWCWAAS